MMRFASVTLYFLLGCVVSLNAQKCAYSGTCYFDKSIRMSVPCAVDGSPNATFSDDQWKHFQEFCDDLAPSVTDRKVCCDATQFAEMVNGIQGVEAIGMKRCPGCYRSFKNLMCQITCSPRQADFIVVNSTVTIPDVADNVVKEVIYGVDNTFAQSLFATCRSGRSSLYVRLTTLMCGLYGSRCTTERFLNFLGATHSEGGYSPIRIHHVLLDKNLIVKDYAGVNRTLNRQIWPLYDNCSMA